MDFWKTKVRPRVIRGEETAELYVRFFEAEREAWICLDTANQVKAAAAARDHWVRMKAIGLPALLAELAPDKKPTKTATVGEAIAAAEKLAIVRPVSFLGCAKKLRQIAGEIAGIERPKKATSWNSEEAAAWRARLDAVPLSRLTAEAANKWKAERIAAHSGDPVKRRSATVTADAILRMARAVFSEKILAAGLGKVVNLPTPLPFAGVAYGKSTRRFVSSVDPAGLFASARADLEAKHPQQFLAFCLCLLAGLRRSEADRLTWAQVDLPGSVIKIHATEYFEPKSEEAGREIDLDEAAVEILRRAKSDTPDPIFVLKGSAPRSQNSAAPSYRADAAPHRTWEQLIAWLATKGIDDGKPIHVLRKLAGSLVFQSHGIEQARGFLGHGDVSTTSRSYIAKTRKVTISLAPPEDEVAAERAKGGAK
ncbi:MAG: site-specific integrase [Opitutaceae bacterium]|nr:site-specific integrase [Opitutaceae bacterium]